MPNETAKSEASGAQDTDVGVCERKLKVERTAQKSEHKNINIIQRRKLLEST